MSRTMRRWVLVGAAALAGIGAAETWAPGSATADAAPKSSPFAGVYDGIVPIEWSPGWSDWIWPITISSSGQVSSSYDFKAQYSGGDRTGTLGGTVDASGKLSIRGREWHGYINGFPGPSYDPDRRRFSVSAVVHADASGNLVGVTDTGATFTWYRR